MAKKLFLLDGMALVYRAHFAFSRNPRVNSKGLNTGAILGFTNSLVEVIEKQKPTHIGVSFDTAEPTFRHEMYQEYKANREEQPEDITLALPYVRQIVEAFNIPLLIKPGFEADDIIGTVAKRMGKEDFEVYMMTIDKDYAQLVTENIFLYKPSYSGSDIEIWDIPKVLEKFEIARVEQVIDVLGLQGDTSDNIPGIPGIGKKTAIKLLKEYDSVEGLIANAHKLKGKQRENVENFSEQGILSKKLATIDINVEIEATEAALQYSGFDKEKLKAVFDELEFRTLSKRLFNETPTKTTTAKPKKKNEAQTSLFSEPQAQTESVEEQIIEFSNIHNTVHHYHLMDTPELCHKLAERLEKQEEFCFDTETTNIDALKAELVGIAFSYYPTEAYYVPINAENEKEILPIFKSVFENEKIAKIAQNLKYDYMVLKNYGIEVKGKFFDTMLAHYLLEPDMRHNMDRLARNELQYEAVEIETLIGKKGKKQGSMRDVPLEKVKEYAGEDADITLQLKHQFAPKIEKNNLEELLFDLETPLISVLVAMETQGIRLDKEGLAEISKELTLEVQKLEEGIYKKAGTTFNIASPKQLGEILFDKLKLDENAKKTKTGQYATGEEILVRLAEKHEIVAEVLHFRELVKLKNTYVDALPELVNPETGKIHTSYNQAVAATGRLSSTNPNLQNIPIRTAQGREVRKAFIPSNENYVLLAADYSQIELRLMAAFSQDETMISAFQNKVDIHSTTASKLYKVGIEDVDTEMRRRAKTANFGIIYGISAHGLSQRLNIPRPEAGEIIRNYFTEFAAVKSYMNDVIEQAREKGYVETIMGRRRFLRNINARNRVDREHAERNAINTPIQGSAADMIKIAMIRIQDFLQSEKLKTKMLLQVHDELVFDVHKEELEYIQPKIAELMKTAIPDLPVPMEVEMGIGQNWLEAH